MTQPTLSVEIGRLAGWIMGESLLGTDTFMATYEFEDITDRVTNLSIRRGRQHELDRIETGTAQATLINQDGAFTPNNTASPYYPDIRPMTPLRIRATVEEAAFAPTDIAGLTGWYDFSDITALFQDTARTTPITADGQIIKGVTDKSGAGNHLSEATNGPSYEEAIQNGLSVARFDGSNDMLAKTGMTAPSAGWTCFFVFVKTGALTAVNDSCISLLSDDESVFFTNTSSHATGLNWYATQGNGIATNVITDPLSWGIRVARVNSVSSMDIYNAGGTPVNLDPDDGILTNQTALALSHQPGPTSFGDYDHAEVALFNVALSATNMNLMGSYLSAKWGLTWTAV